MPPQIPSEIATKRLDNHLRRLLSTGKEAADVCVFLQGMLGGLMLAARGRTLWIGDDNTTAFAVRVVKRKGGLTMANFLAEVQDSYGTRAYALITIALNGRRLLQLLDEIEQRR